MRSSMCLNADISQIQAVLNEGVISLEKVGPHSNPSDVLSKFVQAAVLGPHLPKRNIFRDPRLSQVSQYSCTGQSKIKQVSSNQINVAPRAHDIISSVYQHVTCKQPSTRSGNFKRVCIHVLGRDVSGETRSSHSAFSSGFKLKEKSFTSPPRRGSKPTKKSTDSLPISDSQSDRVFAQRLGQGVDQPQTFSDSERVFILCPFHQECVPSQFRYLVHLQGPKGFPQKGHP